MLCLEILPCLPDTWAASLGIIQILPSQTIEFTFLWRTHEFNVQYKTVQKPTELKS